MFQVQPIITEIKHNMEKIMIGSMNKNVDINFSVHHLLKVDRLENQIIFKILGAKTYFEKYEY